jgi:hypothetical protein
VSEAGRSPLLWILVWRLPVIVHAPMTVLPWDGCAETAVVAFLAAAPAVVVGVCARLAAALSTVQMGLFTLLVWVPVVVRGGADAYQWGELAISSALTGAAWVVTDSYRGTTWFGTA